MLTTAREWITENKDLIESAEMLVKIAVYTIGSASRRRFRRRDNPYAGNGAEPRTDSDD